MIENTDLERCPKDLILLVKILRTEESRDLPKVIWLLGDLSSYPDLATISQERKSVS